MHLITVSAFSLVVPETNITKTIKGIYMIIKIETQRKIKKVKPMTYVLGTTVFNTDDYTELKGKTFDEFKQMDMDLTTLFNLKTNDGKCLFETIRYTRSNKKSVTFLGTDGYGHKEDIDEIDNVFVEDVTNKRVTYTEE